MKPVFIECAIRIALTDKTSDHKAPMVNAINNQGGNNTNLIKTYFRIQRRKKYLLTDFMRPE